MRQSVFFFLGVVSAFAWGCGAKTIPQEDTSSAPRESETVAESPVLHSGENSKTPSFGPTDEQWDSEQRSQQVDKHLKFLSNTLVSGRISSGEESADDCLPFVALDCVSDRLQPKVLTTVREEVGFRVRRWVPTKQETVARENVAGRNGVYSELLALLSKSSDGRSAGSTKFARSQFKIVSVHKSGAGLETDVVWQSMVESQKKRIQRSANWRCHWAIENKETLTLTSINVASFEEVAVPIDRRFVDVTGAVAAPIEDFAEQFGDSIDFWYDRLEHRFSMMATGYQGISVADVNGDGLDDVFIPQPGGVVGGLPNRLLVQQPDGSVVDRSAESGLDWLIETHSALFVDFDNDGDQDIVVATVMGLVFAANDGSGKFEKRATRLTPDAPPMSLAAADFE